MRSIRVLTLTAGIVGVLLVGTPTAWAPTVGQPPAPGYPPCTKVGDDGPDVIKGTKKRDVIFGGNGMDRLYGGPGDDEFHAWRGNDQVFGEEGNDRLNGEIGNDLLVGGPGRDVLIGASENDCLVATDGEVDKLKGNLGHDQYEADPDDIIDGSNEQAADCWAKG